MIVTVFTGSRAAAVAVTARIAANGPGIDALFRLYDTNDPSNRTEFLPPPQQGVVVNPPPPPPQQGVTATWNVPAALLAAAPGPVFDFGLWLANLSEYPDSVDIWVKMVQNGQPLGAFGSNGLPLNPNAQGEFQLDSFANGSNDTCPVFLKL